jgi:hypothetical protein
VGSAPVMSRSGPGRSRLEVEVEPERAAADRRRGDRRACLLVAADHEGVDVFEPFSSTTSTRSSLVNWICLGTSALAPSQKPAIVFEPTLST